VSLAVAAALALPFASSDALAQINDLSIYSSTPSYHNTKTQVNTNAITVNQGVTHVDASGNYPGLSILNSIYSNGTGTETHTTEIFSNTITNNGSIDGSVGSLGNHLDSSGNHPGLLIKAYTDSNNEHSSGFSYADVSGNIIVNKGSISGSGDFGTKYNISGALGIAAISETHFVGESRPQVQQKAKRFE